MESKKIKIPDAYQPLIEDLRLLHGDGDNPNRMTSKQKDQVWLSLQKYGWTYPIVTNKDGIYADGEQRAQVCIDHEEFYAPVLRLPVTDVDRRMLRQILNKLKGKHDKELDAEEYKRIIEAGEKDNLKNLLNTFGEKLPAELEEPQAPHTLPGSYELIIECRDEAEQKRFFDKLRADGYRVKVLNL